MTFGLLLGAMVLGFAGGVVGAIAYDWRRSRGTPGLIEAHKRELAAAHGTPIEDMFPPSVLPEVILPEDVRRWREDRRRRKEGFRRWKKGLRRAR